MRTPPSASALQVQQGTDVTRDHQPCQQATAPTCVSNGTKAGFLTHGEKRNTNIRSCFLPLWWLMVSCQFWRWRDWWIDGEGLTAGWGGEELKAMDGGEKPGHISGARSWRGKGPWGERDAFQAYSPKAPWACPCHQSQVYIIVSSSGNPSSMTCHWQIFFFFFLNHLPSLLLLEPRVSLSAFVLFVLKWKPKAMCIEFQARELEMCGS